MCYERRGRTRSIVRMSYKSIKSLIFRRIRKQKLCVNDPHKLVLRQPSVCLLLMRSMFLNLQTSLLFQSKVVSSISVRTKSYFGGAQGGWFRKWCHRKSRDRKRPWPEMTSREWSRLHAQPVPALFFLI